MNITLGPPKLMDLKPRITVVGIGGAGCNAINNMIATQLDGVEFVVANTDAQSLNMSNAERRIQLGVNLTEGLGAGARPEVGEAAAREAEEDIRAEIAGSHMVFIAAGMGGGTGTGAASIIAEIARDLGILTVGIVSKPFQFEGARRMRTADAGIIALEKVVDTLIVIPNQNLFRIANERTTFAEAFRLADQVLYSGIACIVDLIVKEGLINLDFADVQAVMKGMGTAMMGTGEASGDDRALSAANEAIANPLLDNISLSGAQGLLISIVGGDDLTLYEVDTAASHIRKEVAGDANIIVGATTEEGMDNRIRVSIVASGMSQQGAAGEPGSHAGAGRTQYEPTNVPPPVAASVAAVGAQSMTSPASGAAAQPSAPDFRRLPDDTDGSATASTRADAAMPTAYASEPDHAGPPALPERGEDGNGMSEMASDEADEFARALTEAIGASAEEDAGDASRDLNDDTDDGMGAWQSADGVFVEEGFATGLDAAVSAQTGAASPQLDQSGRDQPPPLPAGGSARERGAPVGFEPVPPAEVRRQTPRMPDVSDFPEVAQREYFAKMEATRTEALSAVQDRDADATEVASGSERGLSAFPPARADAASTPQPQRRPQEPREQAPSKPGLLRRLTGAARK